MFECKSLFYIIKQICLNTHTHTQTDIKAGINSNNQLTTKLEIKLTGLLLDGLCLPNLMNVII